MLPAPGFILYVKLYEFSELSIRKLRLHDRISRVAPRGVCGKRAAEVHLMQ